MERITADKAARTFSGLLERVRDEGESFEIMSGGEVVARIMPAAEPSPKTKTLGEFVEAMRTWPRLDPEDAMAFEKDLAEIRKEFPIPDNEWD